MDLEKNKQRLEILAAEVEELKNGGGGGGTVDAYTKAEADDKFATNEELEGYVSKTDADDDYISKDFPIIGGTIGDNINVDNSIAIGKNVDNQKGSLYNSTVLGTYKFGGYYNSNISNAVYISSNGNGNSIRNITDGVLIGEDNDFNTINSSVIIARGATITGIFQPFYSTILGSFPQLNNLFVDGI